MIKDDYLDKIKDAANFQNGIFVFSSEIRYEKNNEYVISYIFTNSTKEKLLLEFSDVSELGYIVDYEKNISNSIFFIDATTLDIKELSKYITSFTNWCRFYKNTLLIKINVNRMPYSNEYDTMSIPSGILFNCDFYSIITDKISIRKNRYVF